MCVPGPLVYPDGSVVAVAPMSRKLIASMVTIPLIVVSGFVLFVASLPASIPIKCARYEMQDVTSYPLLPFMFFRGVMVPLALSPSTNRELVCVKWYRDDDGPKPDSD